VRVGVRGEGECDVGEDESEMHEVEGEIVERRSSPWVLPSLHVFVLISVKLIWCSVIFFVYSKSEYTIESGSVSVRPAGR
jgi:hypothetical protein